MKLERGNPFGQLAGTPIGKMVQLAHAGKLNLFSDKQAKHCLISPLHFPTV
jgi:hypothetical protein